MSLDGPYIVQRGSIFLLVYGFVERYTSESYCGALCSQAKGLPATWAASARGISADSPN